MVRRHQNSNTRFKLIITRVIANKYSLTIIISCNMETQTVDSLYEDGLVMNNLWRLSFWLQVKQASFKAAQIFGLNLTTFQTHLDNNLDSFSKFANVNADIQVCKFKHIVVSLTYSFFPNIWVQLGLNWHTMQMQFPLRTLSPSSTRYHTYRVQGRQRLYSGRMVIGQ